VLRTNVNVGVVSGSGVAHTNLMPSLLP